MNANTVKSHHCKQCGDPIRNRPTWRLTVQEYPYNPEWAVEALDAGAFCSPQCLGSYLALVVT